MTATYASYEDTFKGPQSRPLSFEKPCGLFLRKSGPLKNLPLKQNRPDENKWWLCMYDYNHIWMWSVAIKPKTNGYDDRPPQTIPLKTINLKKLQTLQFSWYQHADRYSQAFFSRFQDKTCKRSYVCLCFYHFPIMYHWRKDNRHSYHEPGWSSCQLTSLYVWPSCISCHTYQARSPRPQVDISCPWTRFSWWLRSTLRRPLTQSQMMNQKLHYSVLLQNQRRVATDEHRETSWHCLESC